MIKIYVQKNSKRVIFFNCENSNQNLIYISVLFTTKLIYRILCLLSVFFYKIRIIKILLGIQSFLYLLVTQ